MVEPYVREHSKPLWNGEDIFVSLVSYKVTGLIPFIVRGEKVFMSQQSTGIHFADGHDGYRDDFLKYVVEALELRYPDYPEGLQKRNSVGGGVGRDGQMLLRVRRRRRVIE